MDTTDIKNRSVVEILKILKTRTNGLSSQEAQNRLRDYGNNSIQKNEPVAFSCFLDIFGVPSPGWLRLPLSFRRLFANPRIFASS